MSAETQTVYVAYTNTDCTEGRGTEVPNDTQLLNFLRAESLDLRCIDVPTGGDDYDIRWLVIGHYQEKPRERLIGESFTDEPRDAIKDAMANTDARGSYGHPAAPAQEPQQPELEALRIQVRQADERGDEALRLAHAWERAAVESGGWLPDATGYPRWSASKAKAAAQAQDGAVAELVDVLKTVVAVSGLASIAIAKHGTDGGQSNG